ncbi:MAG: hypothetical protein GF308_02580 [Candidatus Heimdallarchaeota archaeon]|nr:hypothetical protein [Candidatus Heimdallarchaeota archaeon]
MAQKDNIRFLLDQLIESKMIDDIDLLLDDYEEFDDLELETEDKGGENLEKEEVGASLVTTEIDIPGSEDYIDDPFSTILELVREDPEKLTELIQIFNTEEDENTLVEIVWIFGNLKEQADEVIPPLLNVLKEKQDDENYDWLVNESIQAFGHLGETAKAAVPDLLLFLKETDDEDFIYSILGAFSDIGKFASLAIPEIVKIIQKNDFESEDIIPEALRSLAMIGEIPPRILPSLRDFSEDPDKNIQLWAKTCLALVGKLSEKEHISFLKKEFEQSDDLTSGISEALALFKDSTDLVYDYLDQLKRPDLSEYQRYVLKERLLKTEDFSLQDLLHLIKKEKNGGLRSAMIDLLINIPAADFSDDCKEALLQVLEKDSSVKARLSAVRVLIYHQERNNYLEDIEKALFHHLQREKNGAIVLKLLEYFYSNAMPFTPNQVEQILFLIGSNLSWNVYETLIKISQKSNYSQEELASLILTKLKETRNDAIKCNLIGAVGLLGTAAKIAIPQLITILQNDKNITPLRRCSAYVLGKIGAPAKEALPHLAKAYEALDENWDENYDFLETKNGEELNNYAHIIGALSTVYIAIESIIKDDPSPAIQIYKPLLEEPIPFSLQLEVLKQLGRTNHQEVIVYIQNFLQDPTLSTPSRLTVLNTLKELGGKIQSYVKPALLPAIAQITPATSDKDCRSAIHTILTILSLSDTPSALLGEAAFAIFRATKFQSFSIWTYADRTWGELKKTRRELLADSLMAYFQSEKKKDLSLNELVENFELVLSIDPNHTRALTEKKRVEEEISRIEQENYLKNVLLKDGQARIADKNFHAAEKIYKKMKGIDATHPLVRQFHDKLVQEKEEWLKKKEEEKEKQLKAMYRKVKRSLKAEKISQALQQIAKIEQMDPDNEMIAKLRTAVKTKEEEIKQREEEALQQKKALEEAERREEEARRKKEEEKLLTEKNLQQKEIDERKTLLKNIVEVYSKIHIEDMARLLNFDDVIALQRWLLKLPEKSFYIEGDEVIIGRSFKEADQDAEEMINNLLKSFEEKETRKVGKK